MGLVNPELQCSKEKVTSNSKKDIRRFIATVNAPALTDEQMKRAKKQFHEDMESRRKASDKALINSMEDAKKFYSD